MKWQDDVTLINHLLFLASCRIQIHPYEATTTKNRGRKQVFFALGELVSLSPIKFVPRTCKFKCHKSQLCTICQAQSTLAQRREKDKRMFGCSQFWRATSTILVMPALNTFILTRAKFLTDQCPTNCLCLTKRISHSLEKRDTT